MSAPRWTVAIAWVPVALGALGVVATARIEDASANAPHAAPIARVTGVAITVEDLERSLDFYTRVLPFTVVDRRTESGPAVEYREGVFGARLEVAALVLGRERIELRQFVAASGRPFPIEAKPNDALFQHVAIVVRDMDAAYALLERHGVIHASNEPRTLPEWNTNAAGISAFYFRDPDLHWLELIHFPPDKGDPRWHETGDALFLGIDHTAIVVDDTETALAFWRDTLGLRVVGGSENYGIEQEHLNGVFGARLRITTLRADEGIGVELLDYLSPCDGALGERDRRANDVAHWWTQLEARDLAAIEGVTKARAPRWVSPGGIDLDATRVFTMRDPDAHGVAIRMASD
ncbi:MAG: VOC family protein [Planctomycetes bacterium]|nr:VOC family protein [Planctomycetota bacterium]MCC7170037.1 VOC family protein [Planctomycetota bacterium]